jgi:hypothetical protein
MGNREVSRIGFLGPCVHLWGARPEASLEEEGGSWEKHDFPHSTESKAEEAA